MFIKKFIVTVIVCMFSLAALYALDASDDKELLTKASFSIEMDGATLSFVLLNNKTVDLLFTGSSKYAIRARANTTTVFYVRGKTDKNLDFKPKFEVVQDGHYIGAKAINIKNFVNGTLEKGTPIEGLLELPQKLNMYRPFKLRDDKAEYAEFQYDWDAIEEMKNE